MPRISAGAVAVALRMLPGGTQTSAVTLSADAVADVTRSGRHIVVEYCNTFETSTINQYTFPQRLFVVIRDLTESMVY